MFAGLGLAVVARIVEQLGGQLRVKSELEQGSHFSFLLPLSLPEDGTKPSPRSSTPSSFYTSPRSRAPSLHADAEIRSLVQAFASDHMSAGPRTISTGNTPPPADKKNTFNDADSKTPLRPIRVDEYKVDTPVRTAYFANAPMRSPVEYIPNGFTAQTDYVPNAVAEGQFKMRVLIVEVRTSFFECDA